MAYTSTSSGNLNRDPLGTTVSLQQAWTIAVRVRFSALTAGYQQTIGIFGNTGYVDGFSLIHSGGGSGVGPIVASVMRNSVETFCNGTTLLVTNTWYHLCATWDLSNIRVYVNGVLETTTAAAPTGMGNILEIATGLIDGSGQDAVFIAGRAAPAEEVAQLVAARRPRRMDGLLAWFPCHIGQLGTDYSGNARNLSLGGSVTDATIDAGVSWGAANPIYLPASGSTINVDGSGTSVFGGGATPTAAKAAAGAAGAVFGAAGTPTAAKAAVGSGGAVFGGSGTPTAAKAAAGSGGSVFGAGVATAAVTKAVAGSGGSVFGGEGNPGTGTIIDVVGSGTAVFGGGATPTAAKAAAGAGGAVFGGGATPTTLKLVAGSGGAVFGGTSAPSSLKQAAGSGTAVFGGTGTATGGVTPPPAVSVVRTTYGNRRMLYTVAPRRRIR